MPLSRARLEDIRNECIADDIELPEEAVSWTEREAFSFFESGGVCFPRKEGLEGAETHAWHDMTQRQFETTDSGTMVEALAVALFKVTGQDEFKQKNEREASLR